MLPPPLYPIQKYESATTAVDSLSALNPSLTHHLIIKKRIGSLRFASDNRLVSTTFKIQAITENGALHRPIK